MKKRVLSLLLVCVTVLGCFTGCAGSSKSKVDVPTEIIAAVGKATSVQASVGVAMQARVGTNSSSSGHNASLGADITVTSTKEPFAYHGEYYSNILVDGVSTREDKEYYVVQDEGNYTRYEYTDGTEEWNKSSVSRADAMALPLKTCLIQNWDVLLNSLVCQNETVTLGNKAAYKFEGKVPAIFIQELVGDKVFGSFMYSVEKLLNDSIPCVAYFDAETFLPIKIELDFEDSFIVNDMFIDEATITAEYSKWNEIDAIELPKKISIVSSDKEAEFYATYYAWNLFLPYINGNSKDNSSGNNSNLSFSAAWNTFQLRIDNGMTKLPFTYEDLHNLGYNIATTYSSNILEPNCVIKDVPVKKGKDEILCSFYNPDTTPRPIIDCSIGSVDIKAASLPQNSINIYFPGEITLGVTRKAIEAAYGKPTSSVQGFSSDTLTWTSKDNEGQFFLVEVSPITNEVIRIRLENIPISPRETTEAGPSEAETIAEDVPEETVEETTSETVAETVAE